MNKQVVQRVQISQWIRLIFYRDTAVVWNGASRTEISLASRGDWAGHFKQTLSDYEITRFHALLDSKEQDLWASNAQ